MKSEELKATFKTPAAKPRAALDSLLLTPHPKTGTVLGFDFGTRRIGVAVGDLAVGIAHPLQTIAAEDNRTRFAAIARLVREWQPALVVVGMPAHRDGAEHEVGHLCRRFAQRLRGRFGIRVELVDEQLSSHAARKALEESGIARRKHKPVLDQAAAQLILQSYLEAQTGKRTS